MSSTARTHKRAPRHEPSSPVLYKSLADDSTVPTHIRQLHKVAEEVTKHSFNAAWMPFLAQLQKALDAHQPELINVCRTSISWKAADHHKREAGFCPELDFDGMLTLRDWIDQDGPNGHAFSLAVMTTPIVGHVKEGREYSKSQDWHIWVLMTAHAPEVSNGKTLITFDSEVEPYHNQVRERNALTFEFSYVDYIRKNKAGHSKERVWQNVGPLTIRQSRPSGLRASRYLTKIAPTQLGPTPLMPIGDQLLVLSRASLLSAGIIYG
ncbi:hypothetical protein B0H14DRAFT_3164125 [Mycena olivaceomarginata]|nr:hypothetical protein B0H14DRAFT_3164125 [Mycena olivaceomarginata]